MKTLRFFLLVLVCGMWAASSAWAETLVYGARGTSDTAVGINSTTLAYGGVQSNLPGPPAADLQGGDISMGIQYAYMVDTAGHVQQLGAGNLSATGVKTDSSTGWDASDIFVSVDVGADGYVYAARNAASAVKLNPVTLTYAGAYSYNPGSGGVQGSDISVGSQYAYMVQGYAGNDTIVQLDKTTLAYTGLQTNWGGGALMLSVDVGADGFVYAARNGETAVKIDPVTLAYLGVQTLDGSNDMKCKDISVGSEYGYAVRNDGYIIQVDKNTLAAGAGTSWPSGGNLFASVDTAQVPEPGSLALLATGMLGLLAYAWRRRK